MMSYTVTANHSRQEYESLHIIVILLLKDNVDKDVKTTQHLKKTYLIRFRDSSTSFRCPRSLDGCRQCGKKAEVLRSGK